MGDPKQRPTLTEDEMAAMWANIEDQEDLLNRLEDCFDIGKKPKPYQGPAECPTPFKETERLAMGGDPSSQFNLSLAHFKGDGVSQDSEQGAYWLLQAAENGFAPAEYNVGCYCRDREIEPNEQEAHAWFLKAAKQNFGPAQFNLGIMYGNAKQFIAAYAWLYLAEQNHVQDAKENRKQVASFLSAEDLNTARCAAAAWMMDFRDIPRAEPVTNIIGEK
jgi:TPR repeat protein